MFIIILNISLKNFLILIFRAKIQKGKISINIKFILYYLTFVIGFINISFLCNSSLRFKSVF